MIQTARKSFILYNTDDEEDLDIGVNSEANSRRINNVEQSFGSSGQPLGLPGRVLVGEGVLTKMCRKRAKPRQFFLFNDVLVYGNIIIHKKKYNKQHILPLEDVKLDNVDDDGNLRNGWKIISPSKSFVVYAATATEKKEWMAHIRKCVNDILALTFNFQHHCRHCGIVACNACTSKKWLLPLQSSKPIRVCLTCYQKLSKEATDNNVTRKYSSVMTSGDNRNSSGEDSSDDDDDQFRNGGSEQLAINDAHFQSYD
uniref:PH domain-containing protein n=1 Tax=Biomphalaria glabrata TaxID=6526 RepID=A0A2C9JYX0_BIOGL